jgi:hypothetical protein
VLTWEPEDLPAAPWLAEQIADQLGVCEPDGNYGVPRGFSAIDPVREHYRGVEIYPAAHPDGFTDTEITDAARLLRASGTLRGWDGLYPPLPPLTAQTRGATGPS